MAFHPSDAFSFPFAALLTWFEPYLKGIFEECEACGIAIEMDIHITRERMQPDLPPSFATFHAGRPDAALTVKATYKHCEQQAKSSLAIVTCGPAELMRLTANATSSIQANVNRPNSTMKEVYLVSNLAFLLFHLSFTYVLLLSILHPRYTRHLDGNRLCKACRTPTILFNCICSFTDLT